MRFFFEHEVTGTRQRIERRFPERGELVLAVAVGEVGEHEERQPVRRLLVEGAEDTRVVGVAGVTLQHLVSLLPPVSTEVTVQEVDHGPEVASLLDVDLEQVAHVIERGSGQAEGALLFDRGRLGVALDDDQPTEISSVLSWDLLPDILSLVVAESDLAVGFALGEEDAPAVVGHLDMLEVGPTLLADRDRRSEVDRVPLESDRPQLLPPLDILRLPGLQRPLQASIACEIDIVRDLGVDVDVGHDHTLRGS